MPIKQESFRSYHPDDEKNFEKPDTFTIRLNKVEREKFNKDKKKLHQVKDSTTMKQLAKIGSNVLNGEFVGGIIDEIFANERKNERTGLQQIE